ncbi:hypothetical protein EV1_006118 [Malus domestica]
MLRTGFLFDHYSASKLITVCALSSSSKVKPNFVTFTNVLCACSHARLMELVYGVVPGLKHYACMVDILGRSGNLEEVVELIEKMPIAPTAYVWGALLGAYGLHWNVELAEKESSPYA